MGLRVTFAALGFVAALAGCTEATKAVDEVARRSAKAAVAETLTTRFPLVPKAVVTPSHRLHHRQCIRHRNRPIRQSGRSWCQ